MTTPCAIRAAASWVALYGAHSVGPSLAESWMAAEGPAGAPALARLSVERRAAFKDLRYSTAPMRVACVVDGRNASMLSGAPIHKDRRFFAFCQTSTCYRRNRFVNDVRMKSAGLAPFDD